MNQILITDISLYSQWAGSLMIATSCLSLFSQRPLYIRMVGIYGLISAFFQLAQEISFRLPDTFPFFARSNTIGHGFTLAEALIISSIFYYSADSKIFRNRVVLLNAIYIIFYFLAFIFFIENSYSIIRFGRDFLMLVLSIGYFHYLLIKLPEKNLLRFPMFWINSAILFFFSGTLILSFMRDYIVYVLKNDMSGFWAFRNFFRFVFCLLLSYAGLMDLRQLIKNKK